MRFRFAVGAIMTAMNLAVPAATPVPAPPAVGAASYALVDYQSGAVIAEHDMDARREPASLTKIMTIYTIANELASRRVRLDDEVLVSENAWKQEGSRMFIEVGKRVRLEDLMKGDIVQSGNDASVALAEHVSGTEAVFAEVMNQNAERIGMSGSHFVNSTGLPHPDHYTTARDLTRLSAALIRDFPEVYAWFSIREFTWNGITQPNRNKLLGRDGSVDGIKTGFTDNAGYCLAASAEREGRRLIAVIMGAQDERTRADAASALLNYGFRFTETHKVYGAGAQVRQMPVWKGESDTVNLGLSADLYVTTAREQYPEIKARIDVDNPLVAPIAAGAGVGTLTLMLGGQELAKRPLVSLSAVPAGGFFTRLVDSVKLKFQ
jgi:D-alanyl-D-alanine carboxypeptidase (penicillin-binding protein 5/6)